MLDQSWSSATEGVFCSIAVTGSIRAFARCSSSTETDMDLSAIPFRSPLSGYQQQAESLLADYRAADPAAIDLFHRKHPRFLDEKIKWLPKPIADSELRDAALSLDDARLAIARHYDFLDWPSLATHVEAVSRQGPVFAFESAVEAVVNGDLATLEDALRRDSALIRARS